MTRRALTRRLGLAAIGLAIACGPRATPAPSPPTAPPPSGVRVAMEPGRPPVAVFARGGDPSSGLAAVVTTAQIGAERGSAVPVALAAVVQARLGARGIAAEVVPDAEHVRVRALVADAAEAERAVAGVRAALLDPIRADAQLEMEAVRRKLAALRALPRPAPALAAGSACESRLSPGDAEPEPAAGEVERWRAEAIGLGRVVFAVVGADVVGRAAVRAISKAPAWPVARALDPSRPALQGGVVVFDASGELPAGVARTVVVAHVDARRAGSVGRALGDPAGALVARLGGLERGTVLASVSATRHATWGCVALDVRVPADARSPGGTAAIARAIVIAQRELQEASRHATADTPLAQDVRDSAEQIALATGAPASSIDGAELGPVAVGFAAPQTARADVDWPAARDALAKETSALEAAWKQPAIEARVRVEPSQPESFILLASPCGTAAESDEDAGISALVALAAARRSSAAFGVDADPWVASDGVGLIGHAPARAGEAPAATLRRVADAIARSFIVDIPDDVGAAQGSLLAQTSAPLTLLASAVAPSHASWIVPNGTQPSLLRATAAQAAARAEAIRQGPLRAVVLANADAAQAREGVDALDRWATRSAEVRACPAAAAPQAPKPGTYAIETDGASEVYIAAPLQPESARAAALVAAALDGADGLLARALGAGMVRSAGARVLGAPRSPALVIHLEAPAAALDAAVAQARGLLDRLQHGALAEADLARASKALADAEARDALDPRARAIAAFRAPKSAEPPPTLEAARAACAELHDASLVIVAARPRGRRP